MSKSKNFPCGNCFSTSWSTYCQSTTWFFHLIAWNIPSAIAGKIKTTKSNHNATWDESTSGPEATTAMRHCLWWSLSWAGVTWREGDGGMSCCLLFMLLEMLLTLSLLCITLLGNLENEKFQFLHSPGNNWDWQLEQCPPCWKVIWWKQQWWWLYKLYLL